MREIRILGPVSVLSDGEPIAVGGPRQQAALVVLATRAGRRVSVEQLIDGIWGEHPPGSAVKTARAYVSRLGALLGDGALVSDHGGYRLETSEFVVDAVRFADLVQSARVALEDDAPRAAERSLDEALGLWRGQAAGEGAELDGQLPEVLALAELRLAAEELRLDAWLALGRHELAIEAAERLVESEPLREGLWERLMRALYAVGRQADALAAFTTARGTLVEELGLEPGPALTGLQERILRHELPQVGRGDPGGRLPAPVTSFIGRELELATLAELISRSRIVTLVGVGGAGKTRLAIEAATRWRLDRGAPAWFVDLAPLRDERLVLSAVLVALGAAETPGVEPMDVAANRLRSRRTLLLLDNCEHVVDGCARLALALLEACPRLLVVATSRTPLGIAGETVYTVPPMPAPDTQSPRWRPELPAGYDAVRLFLERAKPVGGDGGDLQLVGELCRRLDGLPLAIEFAAARTRSLSLEEIAAGMRDRFALLAPVRRAGPERHRTLRAAIDWSHDLLTDEEQTLLRRLSVFDGGFTADAATDVCDEGLTGSVLELIDRLLDASLLLADPASSPARYRLYETVREYAAERLTEASEQAPIQRKHAHHYWAFAQHAASGLRTRSEQTWLGRIDAEHDNLRAALRWATTPAGDRDVGVGIAIALADYWRLRGTLDEAAGWLCTALDQVPEGSPSQAALQVALGAIHARQHQLEPAVRLLQGGIRTARAARDPALVATGLHWLAGAYGRQGRFAESIPLAEESADLRRQLGDLAGAGWTTGLLGDIATFEGRYAEAAELNDQALQAIREHGPPSMLVGCLHSAAWVAHATGELDVAEALCHEALPLAEEIGDMWQIGNLHERLACCERDRGHPAQSTRHALLALDRFESLNAVGDITAVVELLGGIALDTGDVRRGAMLLAGSEHMRRMSGIAPTWSAVDHKVIDADWANATKLCGADLETVERQAGTLTLEQLISVARQPGS